MTADLNIGGEIGSRWYVVQAQTRREHIAIQHLERQGFRTFFPVQRRARRIGRHTVVSLQAFFPGYVFVELDLERERWRSINGTIGVLRLVGFGEAGRARPSPMPRGLVERLQELGGDDGEIRFEERLQPGDTVRVMGGPFDQLCGTLESAGDHERVTILLNVLSAETRVKISRDMLIAA